MKLLVGFLSSLILFFLSCNNSITNEQETKPLLKTVWNLKSFERNSKITEPAEDQVYNIKFSEDGTFSGKSDCNEISSHFTIDSLNSLIIEDIVTTKLYCGEESFGDEYFNAIHDANSYEITKNGLYIQYGNNSKLYFQQNDIIFNYK